MKFFILGLFGFVLIATTADDFEAPNTFGQPILVTSAGQSADVTIAGMMCKRLKLDAATINSAVVADLSGIKTLIIVPGFSSKGLGEAGISKDDELKRVTALLAAAKKQDVKILMLHIGGKPRRGTQSDEFNRLAAQASSRMIVVEQGNEDGFFSDIARNKKIPLDLVARIADTMKPLEAAFKP